jgi:DNA-directed RNA polymerase beta' subunit
MTGTDIHNMVVSGAKGSLTSMAQIVDAVGYQHVSQRQTWTDSTEITAMGYCFNSYASGLNPMEFVYHQMAAREGIIGISTDTALSGYTNRRACKLMSAVTERDGVVDARGMAGTIHHISVSDPV